MDFNREFVTKTSQETAAIGQSLAAYLMARIGHGGDRKKHFFRIICLWGELGSGKTTFAAGFAQGLGIKSRLLSPTFIIVRRYRIPKSSRFLYHLDLYRVQTAAEIEQLGLAEPYQDSSAFIIAEWAQKLGESLPKRRIDVHFAVRDDGAHQVRLREAA